jgi:hypothetical protein
MSTSLLLSLLLLVQQEQTEAKLRQAEQELSQLRGEVRQQMDRMKDTLERHEREINKPICSAELFWTAGGEDRKVPPSPTAAAPLNLFSIVSKPSSCLPAEIRVTASYMDAGDNLVCSGVVENAATQNSATQTVILDVRPWNLREFVRWRNEPPQANTGAKRLSCLNLEGVAEASDQELARVAYVRVRTTVLPQNGGMSTLEIKLSLR